jgi:hypothetical protein
MKYGVSNAIEFNRLKMISNNQYSYISNLIRSQIKELYEKAIYILPFYLESWSNSNNEVVELPNGDSRTTVVMPSNNSKINAEMNRLSQEIIRLGDELKSLKEDEIKRVSDEIEALSISLKNHDEFYYSFSEISYEAELMGDVDRLSLINKLDKLKSDLEDLRSNEPVQSMVNEAHGLFFL